MFSKDSWDLKYTMNCLMDRLYEIKAQYKTLYKEKQLSGPELCPTPPQGITVGSESSICLAPSFLTSL